MDQAVLLLNVIAGVLAGLAIYHLHRLARAAPRASLRTAWRLMALLLSLTLVLLVYIVIDGYLHRTMGGHDVVDALINFFGAVFIFAIALLSRLSMADVLKNAELEVAAYTDKLTGLPNRRRFDALAPERIEIAERRGESLSLAILDIDHFKKVNDTYGHLFGDEVLRQLAQLLSAQKRAEDVVLRVGGEEFALLVPDTSLAEGMVIAERLRLAVEKTPIRSGDTTLSITVSMGVAELRPGDTLATLGERADKALYSAKRTGRNRVVGESESLAAE